MSNDSANPLGTHTDYPIAYDPSLLFRIDRIKDSDGAIPMAGFDRWTCYELNWLSMHGAPETSVLEMIVPSESRFMVESKSFKLYLMSFAYQRLESDQHLQSFVQKDLSSLLETGNLHFQMFAPDAWDRLQCRRPPGTRIDSGSVTCTIYRRDRSLLSTSGKHLSETVYFDGFRSLCPVTGQPDFATVIISYEGPKLESECLVRYLTSYRDEPGFHEHTGEQILADISTLGHFRELAVECLYTRRGGIEINPLRYLRGGKPPLQHGGRTFRQ